MGTAWGAKAAGFFKHLKLPGVVQDAVSIVLERVELAIEDLAGRLMGLMMGVFTNIASLIISPILAFYLLRDHQVMRERSLQYVPARYRGDVQNMARSVNKALSGFFRGQILVSIFVGGCLSTVVYTCWGFPIPYSSG